MPLKLVFLTTTAFFIGYMASELVSTPKPVKLDSVPFCLHSEYPTMKMMEAHKPPLDQSWVTAGATVKVWVRCELSTG